MDTPHPSPRTNRTHHVPHPVLIEPPHLCQAHQFLLHCHFAGLSARPPAARGADAPPPAPPSYDCFQGTPLHPLARDAHAAFVSASIDAAPSRLQREVAAALRAALRRRAGAEAAGEEAEAEAEEVMEEALHGPSGYSLDIALPARRLCIEVPPRAPPAVVFAAWKRGVPPRRRV